MFFMGWPGYVRVLLRQGWLENFTVTSRAEWGKQYALSAYVSLYGFGIRKQMSALNCQCTIIFVVCRERLIHILMNAMLLPLTII